MSPRASDGGTATGDQPAGRGTSALPLVRCRDVTHEYTRGRRRRWPLSRRGDGPASSVRALDGVSLTVDRGEVVGVAGPSGSGKSTLLHLVAGLTTPTAGRIELAGTDLGSLTERERTAMRHRHVGLVFQRFHLLPSLSARANVALPLVQSGRPRRERRERATELLERVGVGDRVGHRPGQLSGGEQQRVAIARALATDPDVLLADEPTGELDRETGDRVLAVLADLAADRAVVVASHDDATLRRTDRVLRLHDGRLVTDGTE